MSLTISDIINLLLRILGSLLILLLVQTIYDIYYGPLGHIPGPKLAAATRFVLLSHKINGNTEIWRHDLHKKYGDVVQTAPGEVSFATGKAWKEIYGYAPGSKYQRFSKDPKFYVVRRNYTNMILADDRAHARHRKAFANAFSDRALRQQEPLLRKHINNLIQYIQNAANQSKTIDIVKPFTYTTFDIMGELALGESLECLQGSDNVSWLNAIFASIRTSAFMVELQHFPRIAKLIRRVMPASVLKSRREHQRQIVDRVSTRIKTQERTDRKLDIWQMVLDATEDRKLSLDEMYSDAAIFMVAGTETAATFLSGVTFFLLSRPSTLKLLVDELRSTFSSAEDIHINTLAGLPYLNACIEEGLRKYPPVPIGMPRIIGKGGSNVCGYDLPEKTTVYVHHYSAYHSSSNFARPNEFLPERWLEDATSNQESEFYQDKRSTLQPFSVGPRNCLGMSLAYLEMRLTMASVFYRFDLELCDDSKYWDKQKVFNLWQKGSLMVQVRPAGL